MNLEKIDIKKIIWKIKKYLGIFKSYDKRTKLKALLILCVCIMFVCIGLEVKYLTHPSESEVPCVNMVKYTEKEKEGFAKEEVIKKAEHMALQYDYDRAVSFLQGQKDYAAQIKYQEMVEQYEEEKAACVEINPTIVDHVFVHSLIVDPKRAFDGDYSQDGYNQNMVTLKEFQKIIQSMYDRGYVLVSLHDMGKITEDGTMQPQKIYLPEGKKPIVFSQDDVSYYHTYEGDGLASRLVIDESGKVKNEYIDEQGNVTIGDFDMVPVIDSFVEKHPDFSYRGRKGIIALTGYNGVLGYHTDTDYRDQLELQDIQKEWLKKHPEYSYEKDVEEATKVANAMKENGWEFASHTWGHIAVGDCGLEWLQQDTQRWLDTVEPIIGKTDSIIFAFGSDIGNWEPYTEYNEKYSYLKSVGFDYYCNVDGSSLNWVQFGDSYLRQSRMNIDGYRMHMNPEKLAPLFDVSMVYDYKNRPEMASW